MIIMENSKNSRNFATDARKPEIARVIAGEEIKRKTGLSAPHTVHCMPGEIIVVSMLGDANGDANGGSVGPFRLTARVVKVAVTDLKENTFFAVLHLQVAGAEYQVDSRPSDAIALALRVGAPILVAESDGAFERRARSGQIAHLHAQ